MVVHAGGSSAGGGGGGCTGGCCPCSSGMWMFWWWPVLVVEVVVGLVGADEAKQERGGNGRSRVWTMNHRACQATVLRAGLLHRC